LSDVWHYYAYDASLDIADGLVRDIANVAERLSDEATIWRSRDEVAPGLRSVPAHPFTLFYRLAKDTVHIVRVVHERRDLTTVFSK
jgi:toxin ParE1/3/4